MTLYYRLYVTDGAGHIRSFIEFDCADDDAAIRHAERNMAAEHMELWERARRVRTWEPEPANDAAAASAADDRDVRSA